MKDKCLQADLLDNAQAGPKLPRRRSLIVQYLYRDNSGTMTDTGRQDAYYLLDTRL